MLKLGLVMVLCVGLVLAGTNITISEESFGPELIKNGNFDEGTKYWTTYNTYNTPVGAPIIVDSDPAHGNTLEGYASNTGGVPDPVTQDYGGNQTVESLNPDARYNLVFDGKIVRKGGDGKAGPSFNDIIVSPPNGQGYNVYEGDPTPYIAASVDEWVTYNWIIKPGGNSLKFGATPIYGGKFRIDNVSLKKVLEESPKSSENGVPAVAYAYSTYRAGNDKASHDKIFTELGWPHHKWENVHVGQLADNLGCYDLLLCHGIYNLGNPQDFKPYREKWLTFLNRGGVIVIVGPQDTPAQWDWLVDLGTDFQFEITSFPAFQKSSDWTNPDAEMNFGQVDARWAHFRTWSPKWTVTNRDVHDKPIVLYQRVGKGLIVVSTSYLDAFSRARDLSKIWEFAHRSDARISLEIKKVSWGTKTLGPTQVNLTVHNNSKQAIDFEAVLTLFNDGSTPSVKDSKARVEANQEFVLSLPYAIVSGDNEVSLVLKSVQDGHVYARTGTRYEMLDIDSHMRVLDQCLRDVKSELARLKEWPREIVETPLKEHEALAAASAALKAELMTGTANVQSCYDKIVAAEQKAKVLVGRVKTWVNLGVTPNPGQKFVVSKSDSLQKLYRDQSWSLGVATELDMELAANEYESLQVVIIPLQGPLEQVRVASSELKSPEGARIADVQVRPVADVYLPLDENFRGWYPDVLLKTDRFDVTGDCVARAIWLTVHTQPDTLPGIYSATVTISPANAPSIELPLSVKVWNFTVPHKRNLPTQFHFRTNQVAKFYFGRNIGREYEKHLTAPMYREFLKFLLPYRIPAHPYNDFEGQSRSATAYLFEKLDGAKVVELDFTEFDKNTQLLLDHGADLIYAGCMLRPDFKGKDLEYWSSFLPKMYEHLKEKGWDKKAFIYGYDEFPPNELPIVRTHFALVKKLAPTVKYLLTFQNAECKPSPDDPGCADIWVPMLGLYSKQLAAERARYEQSTWAYVVNGFEITHPTQDYRGLFWNVWRQRCQGFLYFCTAFFDWDVGTKDLNPDGSPRQTFLPKSTGEATGVYHLCYPAGSNPEDGLNASIRLEAIRDGLEDWEYLYMLSNLIDRSQDKNSSLAREVVELMRQIDAGTGPKLLSVRRSIAEMIEKLKAVSNGSK